MDELRRPVDLTRHSAAVDLTCDEENRLQSPSPDTTESLVADEKALPSFFVIGPPRTGSSWLHEVLSPHAWLPTLSKETRFFDTHFHRGVKWYLAHYGNSREDSSGTRRMGEVAPTYFASTEARERMAQLVPEAKVVCVFRNPVDRVVSLYRLKRAYGLIPWGFEQALERDPELMESSKYASTLKLWQRSFGPRQVMAGIYDDLRHNPQTFIDSLADFVGIPRFRLAAWQYGFVHDSEHMTHPKSYYRTRSATIMADWFKARRLDRVVSAFKRSRLRNFVLGGGPPFPKLPQGTLLQLQEKFQPEIERLEELLQRDLSAWKRP